MQKVRNAALAVVGAMALGLPTLGMAQSTTKDTMNTMMSMGPERGWYAGGSIGQSKADCDVSTFPGASCDDTDTAFRVFGGYTFNKYLGAELGYADLGKVTATVGSLSAEIKSTAWDIVAVGTIPVADKFSLYGKLGFYQGDSKASGVASGSDSSSGMTYTVGAGYDFNKNLGMRVDWQRYTDVGGDTVGKSDVDVIGVGVVYRFR